MAARRTLTAADCDEVLSITAYTDTACAVVAKGSQSASLPPNATHVLPADEVVLPQLTLKLSPPASMNTKDTASPLFAP
jgi:hypothetical protein